MNYLLTVLAILFFLSGCGTIGSIAEATAGGLVKDAVYDGAKSKLKVSSASEPSEYLYDERAQWEREERRVEEREKVLECVEVIEDELQTDYGMFSKRKKERKDEIDDCLDKVEAFINDGNI